ncbi:MAG TPA: pyridoxal-dependent decarboxylase [Candidatus Xenobia bacterium]|jgi:aromatic-L-amino-acid decarboxylase
MRDLSSKEFKRIGYRLVDWIAEYLEDSERYPVLPKVHPGDVKAALPAQAPQAGESMDAILNDFEQTLVPALTHWNHPGFFAYFAISASAPGVLADFLSAALNQQAMLWKTSPASTELEEVTLGWLRKGVGLSDAFEGVIYDTASIATLHGLAAAREATGLNIREKGLQQAPRLRVYCSEQAHSSVDKAVILLGLGQEGLRKIPVDQAFSMDPARLRAAITEDRAQGWHPCAVVATVGTTSTTSVDPVPAIASICETERLWLHVDAAYAGVAALVPEMASTLAGCERADSIVLNPHKWLMVPFDLSAFYCRRMDVVRQAFSLVPEYLRTEHDVNNLMDTGIQLGRRFRSLKLWMVMRYFGLDGLAAILREHVRMAQWLAEEVDKHPHFERMAPTPFSVVCLRAHPPGTTDPDRLNEAIMDQVNASGEVFLSHTKLHGQLVLRVAIGNQHTTWRHVRHLWSLLQEALHQQTATVS